MLNNAKYKYALQYIERHEQQLRADSMTEKLLGNDITAFWKKVRTLNKVGAPLPYSNLGLWT